MPDLSGRSALVTGATSGIGRATAEVLARCGASIMVTGRDPTAAAETVTTITGSGGRAEATVGDLTDSAFADELVAETVERLGRLDIVVNAAGVIVRADAADTTDEEWRRVMATNVDGVFYLSRAAVRVMRDQGGGAIVNVASNVGLVGAAGLPAYCASKGAVVLLSQAMALDHAAENIRINAVCPGSVDTPMLRSGRDRLPMSEAEILESNLTAIPQGRMPQPQEIGELIAFLASDDAGHIVGAAIPIDGGYVAQ